MSTLKEMNYREQTMPDGCWNCKHGGDVDRCELAMDSVPVGECGGEPIWGFEFISVDGICDRYEKDDPLGVVGHSGTGSSKKSVAVTPDE